MRTRLLRRGAYIVLFAFASMFFALRVPQAFSAWRAKNDRIRQLQQENADLRKENDRRKQWINDLKHDRSTQERVLRDRYHKQREGDTDFMLKK